MTFTNSTVSASCSVKTKQGIDRSIAKSCRFPQSSGKIEAVITISVTSLYLPVSKDNQLKTHTNIISYLGSEPIGRAGLHYLVLLI